jgi:HlyD family secretion protein
MSSRLMRIGALVGIAALLTVTIAAAQHRTADSPAGPDVQGIAVFNPVEGRITVLSSLPEGARVEKGEVVCELDPAELKDRLAIEETEVHAARAGAQGARLAHEAAAMELAAYKEDGYAQEVASVEGEIKLAETNLVRAEDELDWGRRMFQKGYSSMAEKIAKELAYKKAQYALEQAQAKRQILVQRSREKTIRMLMAAVETARERELSKQARLQREESTLKKLHDQLGRCKVAAPVAGRVRYDAPIGPGAVAQDGQVLFRIVPDGTRADAAK